MSIPGVRPAPRRGDRACRCFGLSIRSGWPSGQDDFEEDGSALPLDPQSPWLLQQGLLPVTVNLQPTIAYLVPGVAENTSVLMDVGDATIIVTGPFNTSTRS